MAKSFEPMKDSECEHPELLALPQYVSPKLDGYRAVCDGKALLSKNLKPLRNTELQVRFAKPGYAGLDGELIAGDPTTKDAFRHTSSVVTSKDKPAGDVKLYVFDSFFNPREPFHMRYARAGKLVARRDMILVPQTLVYSLKELLATKKKYIDMGYEGAMGRDPYGPYKFGRSTEKEGWLYKLKDFVHAEGMVIGRKEQMRNDNVATLDAMGRTKRSSHKGNKVGKGVLGSYRVLMVNGAFKGAEVDVGVGWDDKERVAEWGVIRDGQIMRLKYFPTGSDKAPRFPVFDGWRDPADM